MDRKVKKRLVGALILIGLVFLLIPIIFHRSNIKPGDISMSPIAPPPPAKLTVDASAARQASTLAATQQNLLEKAPSTPTNKV